MIFDDSQWDIGGIYVQNGPRPLVLRLRFGVSGHLPNAAGEDPEGFNMHSNWSCATARDGTIGDDGDDEAPKKSGLSEHGDTSWGFLEII